MRKLDSMIAPGAAVYAFTFEVTANFHTERFCKAHKIL